MICLKLKLSVSFPEAGRIHVTLFCCSCDRYGADDTCILVNGRYVPAELDLLIVDYSPICQILSMELMEDVAQI